MSGLSHANSFRDLLVYQKAFRIARDIFELTKMFPREERYSLSSQIRRSSRSIGAQIAEAWAKRRYERYFVSKLTDACGEQLETEHWIDTALTCGYLNEEQAAEIRAGLAEIGRMLHGVITKSGLFCGEQPGRVREELAPYFAGEPAAGSTGEAPVTDHP